jgi:type VII secretion protein EssC, C-terminal domain
MRNIIIFKDNRYVEIPADSDMAFNSELQPDSAGAVRASFTNEKYHIMGQELEPFREIFLPYNLNAVLFEEDEKTFSTKLVEESVIIGGAANAHIFLSDTFTLILLEESKLTVLKGSVYLNGKMRFTGTYPVSLGDCILIDHLKITIKNKRLVCSGEKYTSVLKESWNHDEISDEYPIYKRSPRIIKPLPTENVRIELPEKVSEDKTKLLKMIIPPLVTLSATIAMGVATGRGLYMLIGAATTAMTLVFSISSFISDKKERRRKEEKRKKAYEEYLLSKRRQIKELSMSQKESLLYHNPSVFEIAGMIKNHSSRTYERASTDSDFLCFSLGLATEQPSFKVEKPKIKIGDDEDPLQEELLEMIEEYDLLPDMPVIIDLKQSHLGLVGERRNLKKILVSIISQICFHQSYHDIEVITLVQPEDAAEYEWIKWYPHCKVKNINISGLVSAENQRDQVLGNIAQVLKERSQKKSESKKESVFLPHYVFVIDNPKMIINHSIMEHLQVQSMDLGFSIVYTTNIQANLPDNIHTIFNLDSSTEGTLLLNNKLLLNKKVKFYETDNVNLESMSRTLAPVIHNKGISTQIPDSITFFDLYGVKKSEEIPIMKLWQENKCFKSLAVPLGVRAKDDIVNLNLHEKAHGPHGLVAGTTGSGKSEIVQSYILSLAINFHPHDVGFLLIDYKGGGMANLFEKLPHLLGTITNLDGSESVRALASIKSELARRQRILNENGVNNINQYTKLFKMGKAFQPMPHLFLISDEFAELKKEQPDFMNELVSAARIGRSLGVHLILATQKPSGVVDDQIWSNSKFKLALKVQNESDSKEVIKTPDAARITQPGRAYVQVGNNEVYELFQSAWSGAEYSEDVVEKGYDNRVYRINALGQGELLNDDLSEGDSEQGIKETQLDVVVNYISALHKYMGSAAVEKPWLPSLANKIVSPYIYASGRDVGQFTDCNLQVTPGMVDIPEQQKQTLYSHDFFKDGNFAVFGSSGFGKSTCEMTIALELAAKNSPECLNFYVLDFGTSSLIQLKELPHTADYLTFDEEEKLNKFVKLMTEEIRQRKALFASENAMNFKMYNNTAEKKLPAMVIFIDNFDVVREIGMEFENFITKLTRDGMGVGIYSVIDASRASAVKYSILSNFKNKIAQFMIDPSDTMAVVGRSNYKLPEIKGRALVQLEEVCVMQCYLPVWYEGDEAYSANIAAMVRSIADGNTAKAAKGIPMLPEIISYRDVADEDLVKDKKFAVGLDTEDVQIQTLDLKITNHLIVGAAQTGKTNILKLACRQFAQSRIFIVDSKAQDLSDYAGKENITYLYSESDVPQFLGELEMLLQRRETAFLSYGNRIKLKDYTAAAGTVLVIIDDGDNFVEMTKSEVKRTEELLQKAASYGVSFITTTNPNKLRGYDNVTKLLRDSQSGLVLGNPTEQNIFMLPMLRGYKPEIDKGILCVRGAVQNVKIPYIK